MNKKLNINLFFNEQGEEILNVLTYDFKEFLNNYIKKVLN